MKNKIVVWSFVILIFGFSLWNLVTLDKASSDSERRRLQQFPEVSWETVSSGKFMKDFEKYTQDQFAGREVFRTAKAISEIYGFQKLDNNNIYVVNGYASALEYPLDEESVTHAAHRFRDIYDSYLKDTECSVYYSVIPDKNYFLAEKNGYLSMDYDRLFEIVQMEADFMEYIDITGLLDLEDYYLTDTHWKQECLLDIADLLGEELGRRSKGITGDGLNISENQIEKNDYVLEKAEDYEQIVVTDDFYGVYAGQSALLLQPDQLIYLDSPLLQKCVVYDYQNKKEGTVYDLELAEGKDPYEIYLSGDISLMTIQNPSGQTGKELILFRDSFGSSIAPLLMSYYDKITLVDIRYLPGSQLGHYIEFEGQDILFLYSTLVLNNSGTLK